MATSKILFEEGSFFHFQIDSLLDRLLACLSRKREILIIWIWVSFWVSFRTHLGIFHSYLDFPQQASSERPQKTSSVNVLVKLSNYQAIHQSIHPPLTLSNGLTLRLLHGLVTVSEYQSLAALQPVLLHSPVLLLGEPPHKIINRSIDRIDQSAAHPPCQWSRSAFTRACDHQHIKEKRIQNRRKEKIRKVATAAATTNSQTREHPQKESKCKTSSKICIPEYIKFWDHIRDDVTTTSAATSYNINSNYPCVQWNRWSTSTPRHWNCHDTAFCDARIPW